MWHSTYVFNNDNITIHMPISRVTDGWTNRYRDRIIKIYDHEDSYIEWGQRRFSHWFPDASGKVLK